MKETSEFLLWKGDVKFVILTRAVSFWLAFLQTFFKWFLKNGISSLKINKSQPEVSRHKVGFWEFSWNTLKWLYFKGTFKWVQMFYGKRVSFFGYCWLIQSIDILKNFECILGVYFFTCKRFCEVYKIFIKDY